MLISGWLSYLFSNQIINWLISTPPGLFNNIPQNPIVVSTWTIWSLWPACLKHWQLKRIKNKNKINSWKKKKKLSINHELRGVPSVPLSISEEYLWIDAIVGHTDCLGPWVPLMIYISRAPYILYTYLYNFCDFCFLVSNVRKAIIMEIWTKGCLSQHVIILIIIIMPLYYRRWLDWGHHG